jgi:prepilin-type processing-associated H-X9-DG protein
MPLTYGGFCRATRLVVTDQTAANQLCGLINDAALAEDHNDFDGKLRYLAEYQRTIDDLADRGIISIAAGRHVGVINFGMCDGSVRFVSDSIGP